MHQTTRSEDLVPFYKEISEILSLLNASEYHRYFPLTKYMNQIYYPVSLKQYFLSYSHDGKPTGFISWAFLNDYVRHAVLTGKQGIGRDDWCCGEYLFINDFICPYGGVRKFMKSIYINFENDNLKTPVREAMGIRRYRNESVRKIFKLPPVYRSIRSK